jgi:outer membrane protein assembly factor BamB
MYQGAPSHAADACSTITPANVASLKPAWFVPTQGVVTATPAVANGSVFVGDSTGAFYAIDQATGSQEWTFDAVGPQSCYLDQPNPHADAHNVGNGEIASSAAVATVGGRSVVYFGGGGTLFALDAASGKCLWAQDSDPAKPTSPTQVESSPVVDTSVTPPEVLVGNDDNSSPGIAVTGLMAFDASSGALLWKYEPERDLTLTPSEFAGSPALTLACGTGAPTPLDPHCAPANVPDLPPNDQSFADGCGDVWSSPALDSKFVDPAGDNTFEGSGGSAPAGWSAKQITASGQPSADGLVVFGTGNCSADPNPAAALAHGDYVDNPTIFALDPVTGRRVWNFVAPYNAYDNNTQEPGAGDDDFGSSALLATVPSMSVPSSVCVSTDGLTNLVIEGSKSGFAYGLCESTGRTVWSAQISQAGQESADSFGSAGGFIGAPALGVRDGRPTVFITSSVPLPFSNDGIRFPGDGDTNITQCPGAVLDQLPLLPACPDESILSDPARLLSLHAVDAATGQVDWRAVSLPSYGAASYTNGVVFDPMTVGFAEVAYDAETGLPLWSFPLAASPASAAAIAGNGIVLGAGVEDTTGLGVALPPQLTGVWSFTTTAGAPNPALPSLPSVPSLPSLPSLP